MGVKPIVIITFINKLDRDSRDAIELLDEIETILKIRCAPITWPIGMGRDFKGVYDAGLAAAYAQDSTAVKQLDFSLGYHWGNINNQNLMKAEKIGK